MIHLYLYSLPEGFREWCMNKGIHGDLYETYDGSGHAGYVIEFESQALRDRAAKVHLKHSSRRQCLLGEAVGYLGKLYS